MWPSLARYRQNSSSSRAMESWSSVQVLFLLVWASDELAIPSLSEESLGVPFSSIAVGALPSLKNLSTSRYTDVDDKPPVKDEHSPHCRRATLVMMMSALALLINTDELDKEGGVRAEGRWSSGLMSLVVGMSLPHPTLLSI